jgi:hypothetical protein
MTPDSGANSRVVVRGMSGLGTATAVASLLR